MVGARTVLDFIENRDFRLMRRLNRWIASKLLKPKL